MKIGWSTNFIVVDGEQPAAEQLVQLFSAPQRWIVIVRANGSYRYVFSRDEFYQRMLRLVAARTSGALRPDITRELDVLGKQFDAGTDPGSRFGFSREQLFEVMQRNVVPLDSGPNFTLAQALDLHEEQSSTQVNDSSQLAPPDLSWRPGETTPSVMRYVELEPASSKVTAVGGADVLREGKTRGMPPGAGVRASARKPFKGVTSATAPTDAVRAADSEGTTPVRHPSIDPESPVAAGAPVTLVIDLLREATTDTKGGPLDLGPQAADWSRIEVGVTLVSSAIDFDDSGRGTVTVRRNDTSIPSRIRGRVREGIAAGSEIEVHAQFWNGNRSSGSAMRRLRVGPAGAASTATGPQLTQGAMQVDPAAEAPDLTVYITLFDPEAPGRMHWRMVTEAFDGLPPKLDGLINLGRDPAQEAAEMFKKFANLERGKHRSSIEGFGERLWERAPAEFRDVYWALHDHYKRPMAIQFVSDDPHLPWELMRPFREGETHPPLALRHAVARWIGRWNGYMRNRLTAGRMVTVAPHYKSVSAQLSLAEATAAQLVSAFGAKPVNGTREAMRGLLETPPEDPVALLYFTGHGVFDANVVSGSSIKLEDGTLSVDDVARREVRLGERHGTLVFFNACEVGATASALGAVGGWADAFLSRRFRAFIAPLWAIDEEDAAQVTQELMTMIVTDRAPVGAALRDLRAKHGDVSPTYFSYLLYGDVTARLGSIA